MSRSSTSSSRSLPWAGLVAVLLLLAVDRGVLGVNGPWEKLSSGRPTGAAVSRLALQEIRSAPSSEPRVFVVGTSRAFDGFDAELAERELPGFAFAELAHPRFEPFVVRALVDDMIDAGATVAVLLVSELDTHRPLRLEPVPGSMAASSDALLDLLRATDLDFALRNRRSLFRLAASSLLQSYRYREILGEAGLLEARRFEFDDRLGAAKPADRDPFRPVALWGASRKAPPPPARRTTVDLFPPEIDAWRATMQAGTIAEVTRGPHADVQQFLLRRAVERLRAAGVAVLIVETPMHPATRDLYDPSIRDDFAAFAAALAERDGVTFLPIEAMPHFAESDFYDLVHVSWHGSGKLTRAVLDALRAVGRP